jgi:hypothetical protein
MNVQAKVAIEKQEHPERYCPVKRCLWKTSVPNDNGNGYHVHPSYPDGYCPRHQHIRSIKAMIEKQKEIA